MTSLALSTNHFSTLAQYLSAQEDDIPEFKILSMFRQMLEACKYLHDHNILHRYGSVFS